MRLTSQNLSDGQRSKFWHGRAWLYLGGRYKQDSRRSFHWEWSFGKFARDFAATITFGSGDGDDGILFHLCLPWIFSIYFGVERFMRVKKACKTGIAIHNGGGWFYPLPFEMESSSKDPWYRRTYCWHFPWELNWWSTEVCEHERNDENLRAVWRADKRLGKKRVWLKDFEEQEAAAKRVSRDYPYAYILKNREIQHRTATVHVERHEWRARWWPIIPIRKIRTSIAVRFNDEVGEGTGSWKGGVLGCGKDMKWGETPERCLSRMEHEVEFRR